MKPSLHDRLCRAGLTCRKGEMCLVRRAFRAGQAEERKEIAETLRKWSSGPDDDLVAEAIARGERHDPGM